MKCCPVPSTSCDLYTCNVWRCYDEGLRRCIYNKIHYLTFDLYRTDKVTGNIAMYGLHHVTYVPVKFEVNTSNGLEGNAFTRKYII